MQSVQNVAAKFVARVIIWDSLNVQREKVQLCSIFKALRGDSVSREINNRLLAAIYSGRNLYGKKVRGREQRTDISKFSFINRTIEIWKSLAPSLLEVCSEHIFKRIFNHIIKQISFNIFLYKVLFLYNLM